MQRAVLANAAYIRAALKRPFLPDCPAARARNAPVLGSASDIIGGCRVTVSITRASPCLPPACVRAVGEDVGGGGAGAGAAGAAAAALLVSALAGADLGRLCAAAREGRSVLRVAGGGGLVPVAGRHFFQSPEAALGSLTAEEAAAGGASAEWQAVAAAAGRE